MGRLDRSVQAELRSLPRDLAERVGGHLAAAQVLQEDDPVRAYEHAEAARRRAGRLAVVRETCGIVAYRLDRWAEAARELRAARRLGADGTLLAVIADCERGLGRPERALEVAASAEARELVGEARIEMVIVAAGARRDLGQLEAAVVALQVPELRRRGHAAGQARLWYAYADALAAAGRSGEAVRWFGHAAAADRAGETDASARYAELSGEPAPGRSDEGVVDLGDDSAGT